MSRSSIIIEGEALSPPIHPGEILMEEFLRPHGVSQNRLARDIGVPVSRIAGIVKGERAVSADTALRFARFFGTSADLWMGLQAEFDLRMARRQSGTEIDRDVKILAA